MKRLPLILVILVVVALGALLLYGPPRYWGDFTGMTEAEVVDRLGVPEPHDDSRNLARNAQQQEYSLCWRYAGGLFGFVLDFKNGIVVSQTRYGRS